MAMSIPQALAILNPKEKTEKALKEAFRDKAKEYHPDRGGALEMMKVINVAYDMLKDIDWTDEHVFESKSIKAADEVILNIWEKIKYFPGISGEVIGHWLWVSGNTKAYSKELSREGLMYHGKRKVWYWHNDKKYRGWGKKYKTFNQLRQTWGVRSLKKEKKRKVAYN